MQVNNVNNTNYNPQFRAIFKLRNDGSGIADIITKAVSDCTVKSEANKISQKFQLGGGSLYVYVPDENMEKLLKKVNIVLKRDTVAEFLTRLD